jgi:hypothetical protein
MGLDVGMAGLYLDADFRETTLIPPIHGDFA